MKKVLITALAVLSLSVAYADVIYWMVSDAAYEDTRNTNENATDPYAWICATTSDVDSGIRIEGKSASEVANAYWGNSYFETELGSYGSNAYSFYVELWNGTKTTPETYDSLVNSYIARSGSIATPTTLASGGFGQAPGHNTYNVPEPTSGLLFLVGGMLLGLRRRRQQV